MSKRSGVYPPSDITVSVDDPPVVGRIFGPRGELLRVVRAKEKRRIGFVPDSKRDEDDGTS